MDNEAKKKEEADHSAVIKELEAKSAAQEQLILSLQKQIEGFESEKRAAAALKRAQDLISVAEKAGVKFSSDAEREEELTRLASLSDEGFAASEVVYKRICVSASAAVAAATSAATKAANEAATAAAEAAKEEAAKKLEAEAKKKDSMSSTASKRPSNVDDKIGDDCDTKNLSAGFMEVYEAHTL